MAAGPHAGPEGTQALPGRAVSRREAARARVCGRTPQGVRLPSLLSEADCALCCESRFLQGLVRVGLSGRAQWTQAFSMIRVCTPRAEQRTGAILMAPCGPGGSADRRLETARGTHRLDTVQKLFSPSHLWKPGLTEHAGVVMSLLAARVGC